MKRIIILGGLGQFGHTAADELRKLGLLFKISSRRGAADLYLDAEDQDSIRKTIRAGDIVLDAAGPFQARTTALIEAAIDIGFDVIDINDDLRYAESVLALESKINAAGIRVLTSASSVSAISAAMVRRSRMIQPQRITAFLAPASRHTANPGTAISLIQSVGQPIRVFRNGRLEKRIGWSEPKEFPMPRPLGIICGRLFESADAIHLPRVWPSLQNVAMYVDSNTPGINALLRLAARSAFMRRLLVSQARLGTSVARVFGSSVGGIGHEIEDATGKIVRCSITAEKNSFITAVAPAVLAVRAIFEYRFAYRGLVAVDCHVETGELFSYLNSRGITVNL